MIKVCVLPIEEFVDLTLRLQIEGSENVSQAFVCDKWVSGIVTLLLKQITGHIESPSEQQQQTHPKHNLSTNENECNVQQQRERPRWSYLTWFRIYSPFYRDWQIFLQNRVDPRNRCAVFLGSNFWYELRWKLGVESIRQTKSEVERVERRQKRKIKVIGGNFSEISLLWRSYIVTSPIPRTMIGSCSVASGGTSSDKSST